MALSEGYTDVASQSVRTFVDNPNDGNTEEDLYFLELVDLLDQPGKARESLRQFDLDADNLPNVEPILFWLAYFEEYELAERWMQAALEGRTRERGSKGGRLDGTWIQFKPVYPLFDSPYLKQLFLQNNLQPYWREHGWPEFCRPVSESDFECGMDDKS
jgi:hypothetical protein